MPIVLAPIDVNMRIVKVLGDDKNKKHLESLGIIKDASIIVLSKQNGNVIIKIKGSKLALDNKIASTIIVC